MIGDCRSGIDFICSKCGEQMIVSNGEGERSTTFYFFIFFAIACIVVLFYIPVLGALAVLLLWVIGIVSKMCGEKNYSEASSEAEKTYVQTVTDRSMCKPLEIVILDGAGCNNRIGRKSLFSMDESKIYISDLKTLTDMQVDINDIQKIDIYSVFSGIESSIVIGFQNTSIFMLTSSIDIRQLRLLFAPLFRRVNVCSPIKEMSESTQTP